MEKRVIGIYSRKSRFTGQGDSVENQIELCRQYISANFGQAAAKSALVFEDEGFSGGDLDRPSFKKMMALAKKGCLKSIVVYRLDRISRSIGDFAALIETLWDMDISFISIKEQFDTSSPLGRAMMYIASVFSQLERETIGERIRDNMLQLAKTGRWLGGVTPTGYKSKEVGKISLDGKMRKSYALELIPREAEVVTLIYDKFLSLKSLTGTDAFLLQKGYKTKNGKDFSRYTIRNILTNPVYMVADKGAMEYFKSLGADVFGDEKSFNGKSGIMAYNRTLQKKGRANRLRCESEWIIAPGCHGGIVSSKDWISVQNILEKNRSKSYRKPRSNAALLSGILICGSCGSFMRPKMTNRTTASGDGKYIYMCTLKERSRSHLCSGTNVDGNGLDAKAAEVILDSLHLKDIAGFLSESKTFLEGENTQALALQRNIHNKKREIDTLLSVLGEGADDVAAGHILAKIKDLHHSMEKAEEDLRKLEDSKNKLDNRDYEKVVEDLSLPANVYSEMKIDDRRDLAACFLEKVLWDGRRRKSIAEKPVTFPCGRIANEILMYFRSRKKSGGDVSLSDPIDTDRDGSALTLIDLISVEDDMLEKISAIETRERLDKYIKEALTEREADIIANRYGLNGRGPLTQREVAAQRGISRSYVSRIEKKALEKLRTRFSEDGW